jgi:threonine dehydratase
MSTDLGPTISKINLARSLIKENLIKTPVIPLKSDRWMEVLPRDTNVSVKLELFQQAGSFKARGAYLGIQNLSSEQKKQGVVAASGGNHALAVSWAAAAAGVTAKIAMPKTTDPYRIEGCRSVGAEVILCEDIGDSFNVMNALADSERRVMMHPFEGENMTLGSATCAAEYIEQCPGIDLFVIPVGGGGLISGMACMIKKSNPSAIVIGVEPFGAAGLFESFKAGKPISLGTVNTIADSLGSPVTLPYSFSIAKKFVDKIVRVSDHELLESMNYYQDILSITAEPACAASLAAIVGPLKDEVVGRSVGIIACGSNISLTRYNSLLEEL